MEPTVCLLPDAGLVNAITPWGTSAQVQRMSVLSKLLVELGFDERRLRVEWIAASEGEKFAGIVKDFVTQIKK